MTLRCRLQGTGSHPVGTGSGTAQPFESFRVGSFFREGKVAPSFRQTGLIGGLVEVLVHPVDGGVGQQARDARAVPRPFDEEEAVV